MPTIKDVAAKAGVSIGSVSNYLNGKVIKKKNAELIQKAMDELDYHRNFIAKGLKENRSMSIGIIINRLTDYFSMSIVSALENFLEKQGYSIIICDYRGNKERFDKKIDFLLNRSVDAVIVFHQDRSTPGLRKIKSKKIPIIAIDAPIENLKTDVVVVDNYEASKKGVLHLIEEGANYIGIVSGKDANYISRKRQGGYEDALIESGLDVRKQYIWSGDYTIESGYIGTKKLLKANPEMDAIFVINYYMSMGSLKALQEMNVKDKIKVLVFGHFFVNDIFFPTISSIEQPVYEIGKTAGKLIIERLKGEENTNYRTVYCKNTFIK